MNIDKSYVVILNIRNKNAHLWNVFDPIMMAEELGIWELCNIAQLTKAKRVNHIKLSNISTEKKDITREWMNEKLKLLKGYIYYLLTFIFRQ